MFKRISSHAPLDDKSGKTELSAFVSGDLGEGQLLEAAALLVGDLEEYWGCWLIEEDDEATDGDPTGKGEEGATEDDDRPEFRIRWQIRAGWSSLKYPERKDKFINNQKADGIGMLQHTGRFQVSVNGLWYNHPICIRFAPLTPSDGPRRRLGYTRSHDSVFAMAVAMVKATSTTSGNRSICPLHPSGSRLRSVTVWVVVWRMLMLTPMGRITPNIGPKCRWLGHELQLLHFSLTRLRERFSKALALLFSAFTAASPVEASGQCWQNTEESLSPLNGLAPATPAAAHHSHCWPLKGCLAWAERLCCRQWLLSKMAAKARQGCFGRGKMASAPNQEIKSASFTDLKAFSRHVNQVSNIPFFTEGQTCNCNSSNNVDRCHWVQYYFCAATTLLCALLFKMLCS